MKPYIALFALLATVLPGASGAATKCSVANLTRCLDSVCAINVSSNPAARCQYCGTISAGDPPSDNGMRALSVGASSKYTLTEKQLKKAPEDPGDRYAWATVQCLKKVSGCTPDDVTDNYDKLIEQSCRAAGISAQVAALRADMAKKKTKGSCKTEIRSCLIADTRCTSDYRECSENASFDNFFSQCGVDASGCDSYISEIRTELLSARDTAIKNAENALTGLVQSYAKARDSKLKSAQAMCTDNAGREECIESVCTRSMRNKCEPGFESERSMAVQLCKFYELACNVLK